LIFDTPEDVKKKNAREECETRIQKAEVSAKKGYLYASALDTRAAAMRATEFNNRQSVNTLAQQAYTKFISGGDNYNTPQPIRVIHENGDNYVRRYEYFREAASTAHEFSLGHDKVQYATVNMVEALAEDIRSKNFGSASFYLFERITGDIREMVDTTRRYSVDCQAEINRTIEFCKEKLVSHFRSLLRNGA
jgi:hypothetical protein